MSFLEETDDSSSMSTIVYSAGTDVGMRREENQDSYGIMLGQHYRLFIVADGMGGVQGGAVASNLAITTIDKTLRENVSCTADDLVSSIHGANAAIHERGKSDPNLSGMGTTIVSALCTDQGIHVAHVGDSRLYLIRESSITRLTNDHTLVNELVRSGAITEEQAEHHPVSHMLTRSLGPSPKVEVEHYHLTEPIRSNDKLLLCSDGLYNMVKESEIAEIVVKNSTDDAVQLLIDLANERGGNDNITIVIVDLGSDYPSHLESQTSHQDGEDIVLQDINDDVPGIGSQNSVSTRGGYHDTAEVQHAEASEPIMEQIEEPEVDESEALTASEAHNAEVLADLPVTEAVPQFEKEEEAIEPIDPQYEEFQLPRQNRLPLLAFGFIGGILVAFVGLKALEVFDGSEKEPMVQPTEATYVEASDDQHSILPSISVVYQDGEMEPGTAASGVAGDEDHKSERVLPKLGPIERSSIDRRKAELINLLSNIEGKLDKLDKPLTSELGEMLKSSTRKAEELQSKIEQIKADTDLATRKLALWYDRKRRLETTDAINLATEIATTVPAVKQKKDEFERATWDYLKEVESLRYNPNDPWKENHVTELVKIRSARMSELATEVRLSIDKALSDADHGIAELTNQRTGYESALESARSDLDFVRTITGSDTVRKEKLRKELIRRKESAQNELESLQKLVPAT